MPFVVRLLQGPSDRGCRPQNVPQDHMVARGFNLRVERNRTLLVFGGQAKISVFVHFSERLLSLCCGTSFNSELFIVPLSIGAAIMLSTPHSGKDHGGQGVSLLFTPKVDGQTTSEWARSGSQLGRSRAQTQTRWEATPPSRGRRSMTPASSNAKETPPPPPSNSLFDSPVGGASLATWGQRTEVGEETEASPSAAVLAAHQQQQRDLARANRVQYEDSWVTVFGISQSDIPMVLKEFSKCGDIIEFGTFGEASSVNWIHINYSSKHGAQRALLRNGEQLSQFCMVGVKGLEPAQKAAIHGFMTDGNETTSSSFMLPIPKPAQSTRSYAFDSSAGASSVVPLCNKSTWQKISELVLGL